MGGEIAGEIVDRESKRGPGEIVDLDVEKDGERDRWTNWRRRVRRGSRERAARAEREARTERKENWGKIGRRACV